ncbi:MAG: tetratricopeptide repeat protein, partial [Desulfuromonadaceae bacterium]
MTLEEITNAALDHMEQGNYTAAVKVLEQGYAQFPEDDDLLVLFAEALGAEGSEDRAISMLQQRLERGDAPAEVLFALGDEYFVKGKHEEAIECYRQLLSEAGSAAEANVRIGLVKIAEQACEKAEEYFHKALQIDENCFAAANSLGDMFFEGGHLQQAKN